MGTWEAPREVLMQGIAAALEDELNVPGPRFWGGVYPRPVAVSRLFRHPYQVPDTPHLIVVQDDGSQIAPIGHDFDDPATIYEDRFRFIVYAYVDGDDIDTPSKWLERVNLDCKRVLKRAVAVGGALEGLAANLRFLDEAVDFHDTRAAGSIPCLVQLRYPLGPDLELP